MVGTKPFLTSQTCSPTANQPGLSVSLSLVVHALEPSVNSADSRVDVVMVRSWARIDRIELLHCAANSDRSMVFIC
jgi:hypothetical protein